MFPMCVSIVSPNIAVDTNKYLLCWWSIGGNNNPGHLRLELWLSNGQWTRTQDQMCPPPSGNWISMAVGASYILLISFPVAVHPPEADETQKFSTQK